MTDTPNKGRAGTLAPRRRRPPAAPGIAVCIALAALATGACGDFDRPEAYDRPLQIEGPVELDQHVAFLNRTLEEVVLIQADGGSLEILHRPVGRQPIGLAVTPDRQRLSVLSQRDQTMTIIDVATAETRVYPLSSKFDSATFSPDGRYAIVYFSPGYSPPAGELYNPNEYVVIDLEAAPDAAATPRALRNFGTSFSAVHFLPLFELSDNAEPERYAMFLFDSQVTFADLTSTTYEKTVFLRLSPAQDPIRPTKVMFTDSNQSPELQDFFVYMLAEGTDDVYAINLLPGESVEGRVRVQPSVNQLSSGRRPSDMATFVGPDGREKVLTVNSGSQDIAIIDAATNAVTRIPLEHAANRLHLYEAFNEDAGEIQVHALLYGEGLSTPLVSFVRLMEAEDRFGQAVEPQSVGSGVARLLNSPIDGQVIVLHQGGGGISLLDLHQRYATRLQTSLTVNDLVVDQTGRRLFASLAGSPNLNMVDLGRGQATSLPLDFPIDNLVWLPQVDSLLAFHESVGGLVTALRIEPLAAEVAVVPPTRSDARIYAGYLFDGLLEREP